jgi:hypothetical protein
VSKSGSCWQVGGGSVLYLHVVSAFLLQASVFPGVAAAHGWVVASVICDDLSWWLLPLQLARAGAGQQPPLCCRQPEALRDRSIQATHARGTSTQATSSMRNAGRSIRSVEIVCCCPANPSLPCNCRFLRAGTSLKSSGRSIQEILVSEIAVQLHLRCASNFPCKSATSHPAVLQLLLSYEQAPV